MHKPVMTALFLGAAISAYSAPAEAQAQVQSFNIPAGNLKAALDRFTRQTGVQIIYREADLKSRNSPGVRGTMPTEAALRALLGDTGLIQQQGRTGAIAIVPAARQSRISYQTEQPSSPPAASIAPAATEAPADEGAAAYGDIIVTAQRKEQRLQDVPVSVSVTSGETLAQSNINDLQDLAVRLPGVRLSTAPGANLLNIRGIGSGINAGFEQSVGTFVDGLYRGRSRAAAAALFDIERIEVLKGPQTTYFGNNVIAGALNITTRKPGREFGFNASALYAPGHEEYAYEAGVDIPLSDAVRFRIAGKAFGMNGWNENSLTGESEPHKRDWIGRVSMVADASENWTIEARFDRGRMRDRGYLSAELVDCPPQAPFPALPANALCSIYLAQNGGDVDDEIDQNTAYHGSLYHLDFVEAELTNRITLGDHQLTSITGYYHHDNQVLSDGIPLPFTQPFLPTAHALLAINTYEEAEQYSQELRLEGPTGGMFEYMAGVYYAHEKVEAPQYSGFYFAPFGALVGLSPTLPIVMKNDYSQKTDTYSPFAALTFNATERLKINFGARYTIVRKRASTTVVYGTALPYGTPDTFTPFPAGQTSPAYPDPEAFLSRLDQLIVAERPDFVDPTNTFKKFMPSVNIQYQFTPEITGYASYSKGFKAGGFGLTLRRNTFDSENVDAYEAGLKASLFDRRLFLTLAAFRSDYKGLQESTVNILPAFPGNPPGDLATALPARFDYRVLNAASARSQGIELGMNLRAAGWLSINADISYLDAKYRSFPGAPCTSLGNVLGAAVGCVNGTQDLSGKPKAFAPEWSGNVGANLAIPLGDDFELTLNPSVYFTSQYYFSSIADPIFSQSGYAKIDLRAAIGAPDKSWEFAVIAKNLTDKDTATFANSLATSPGVYYRTTERPRSVAFQFTVRQ